MTERPVVWTAVADSAGVKRRRQPNMTFAAGSQCVWIWDEPCNGIVLFMWKQIMRGQCNETCRGGMRTPFRPSFPLFAAVAFRIVIAFQKVFASCCFAVCCGFQLIICERAYLSLSTPSTPSNIFWNRSPPNFLKSLSFIVLISRFVNRKNQSFSWYEVNFLEP